MRLGNNPVLHLLSPALSFMLTRTHTHSFLTHVQDVSSIDLSDILPAAYITGVAISTAGSVGAELPEREMRVVVDACNALIELDETHSKVFTVRGTLHTCSPTTHPRHSHISTNTPHTQILSFVESRILFLAPNLARLLGTTITAKLIALAGGLIALARLPANIIQVCLHVLPAEHLTSLSASSSIQ